MAEREKGGRKPRKPITRRPFRDKLWDERLVIFGEMLRAWRESQGKTLLDIEEIIRVDRDDFNEAHYTSLWCGRVERATVRNISDEEIASLFRWYGCPLPLCQHLLLVLNCHTLGLRPSQITPELILLTALVPLFLPTFSAIAQSMAGQQTELMGFNDVTRNMIGLLALRATIDKMLREVFGLSGELPPGLPPLDGGR